MLANLYWFFFFLVVYWSFCLFWGARTLRKNSSPESYYLADRSISSWVFFFSATAATFAGITIITFPSLIYADGYSFLATAAFFCCGSQPASNPPATTAPVATAALVINFLLEEVFKLL